MIRDTLKKAAGLFVTFEEDPNQPIQVTGKPTEEWNVMTADSPEPNKVANKPKTVEQIVREQPGPNLDEIKIPEPAVAPTPSEPVIKADGSVNFNSIYQLASLPKVAFTAEQILELFASLPADLPLESKRTTIKVTMNAMAQSLGVSTEQIVSDASRKLAALSAYNDSFAKQAGDYCAKAEIEIMTLEQQIADKRKAIEDAKAKQSRVHDDCVRESDRLDDVLEFFTLDVPPSKHA